MKLKKKYMIIFVPIVIILLLVGYSIKKNITVKTTAVNNSTSLSKESGKKADTTLTGKSNNENIAPSSTPADASSKDTITSTTKPGAVDIEEVKSLMKQLSSESQVSGSQIYIENNMHFATITFKTDADAKNATEFATKYANLIKKAYNDKNVNVKIVQNEKDIANVVLK